MLCKPFLGNVRIRLYYPGQQKSAYWTCTVPGILHRDRTLNGHVYMLGLNTRNKEEYNLNLNVYYNT